MCFAFKLSTRKRDREKLTSQLNSVAKTTTVAVATVRAARRWSFLDFKANIEQANPFSEIKNDFDRAL